MWYFSKFPNVLTKIDSRIIGIDRYRTDFSKGFFYSPKFFAQKYTCWFKNQRKKATLKAKFKVSKNQILLALKKVPILSFWIHRLCFCSDPYKISLITVALLWPDCAASHSSEHMDRQIVHCTAQSVDPFVQNVRGHSILLQMGEILRDVGPFSAFSPW